MTFYKYKVLFYDEIEEQNKTECGIICGDTTEQVITKLYDYYGKDYLFKFELQPLVEELLPYEDEEVLNTFLLHSLTIEEIF